MGILDNRVAIITGAGGGLGAAHARVFAAEGCAVVVNDINRDAGLHQRRAEDQRREASRYCDTDEPEE